MKIVKLGLGLGVLWGALWGCSGTASTTPPNGGAVPDAGISGANAGGGGGTGGDASGEGPGQGGAGVTAGSGDDGGGGGEPSEAGAGAGGEPGGVCVPGALSCDGARVRLCDLNGSGFLTQQTCSLSQVCSAGECLDVGCVPNTTFCNQGEVWACNEDGTRSSLVAHCMARQFCLEKDRQAYCNDTVCAAGDAMCSGPLATECAADGSGPKPGGEDCTAHGQSCYGGKCQDLVCTPGQRLCDNNSAYLCTDGGTSRTLLSTCAAGTTCDAASGTCQNKICDPGKLGCDSTRVVTCNGAGTGWIQSGPDCSASQSLCVNGACKAPVCTPSQTSCQNNSVYTCSSDGLSTTLYQSCSTYGYHCSQLTGYAYCAPYFCTPGSTGCSGNVLSTCLQDGSGWASGGTDCTQSNSVCIGNYSGVATCSPKVCTANATFCQGGNVLQCDYTGTSSSQRQACTYGTYCKGVGNNASCLATPCLPDNAGCANDKYGTCADDGMSVGSSAQDCGALGQVCTLAGCASSAVDTVASSKQVSTSASYYPLIANTLDVETSRKLTKIEFYLTLPAARTLTWVVYQRNDTNLSEYDLKFQQTNSGNGTGFQSSDAFSLTLAGGKSYAIGVYVSDGTFVDYYDSAVSPPSINFAHVTGSFAASYSNVLAYNFLTSTQLYYSRFTTTAP